MMFSRFKPLLLSVAVAMLLTGATRSLQADDNLSLAAVQYRSKDFVSAYASAGKSSDQTQRSFVRGMAAFRLDRFDKAVPLLADAELKLPLIADYAVFFQAEALLQLKKYPDAAAKAASIKSSFPSSRLVRLSEKLYADILYESGDYKAALKLYDSFIEKYSSGSDAVDASYQSARCREEVADVAGALTIYRSIWLNNPTSELAVKTQERIEQLKGSGFTQTHYSVEELLKRASTQYTHGHYSESLKSLEMIPTVSLSQADASRIDLRTGMALYRLKRYEQAEKLFAKAAVAPLAGVRSEARFWLAKSLDRQDLHERAFALYMELAEEGEKQPFADDALTEAAALMRGLGEYAEAACLFKRAAMLTSGSKVLRATWESGWCSYLAGEYAVAADVFKELVTDEAHREKVLYWLGRTLENRGDVAAASYFQTLLAEFPAGFYATWYRDQNAVEDTRESLGERDPLTELPLAPGFEKPRLLASLGLLGEARAEMTAVRNKNSDKKWSLPVLARAYLEMGDYGSAISLFMQNRPVAWEKGTLPLWAAGYPRAYSNLVSRNAALNGLSDGLVFALIRAESGFAPAVKSGAGAIGLMQMMPATAKMTAREEGAFNPLRLTEPEYNIRLGTKHLHDLMKDHNGDLISMAAAYNAGSGALARWKKNFKGLKEDEFIESIPYQETRNYVKKVYASAATYRKLYGLK